MTEPAAPKRRKKRERVHRKAQGRGWIYRWSEYDAARQKRVRRTSPEYEKKADAELAEAAERMKKTLAKLTARDRRKVGGAWPIVMVIDRWARSRLASGVAGPTWTEEVTRTLTTLCAARKWFTVAEITAEQVDEWMVERAGVAVKGPLTALKSVLNYAYRILRQPVDANVLLLTSKRKRTSKAKPYRYDDDELARVLGMADSWGMNVGTLARHYLLLGQRPKTVVNVTVGDWDEVNRLLAASHNKNGEPLLVAIHDEDFARRLSLLTQGRPRGEQLYLHPDGSPWTGKHGNAARLSTWWKREIGPALLHRRINGRWVDGVYILVDTAVSRMREAGWEAAAIADTTGKRTQRVHDLYDATHRDRLRALWRMLPVLPMPLGNLETTRPRGPAWGQERDQVRPGATNLPDAQAPSSA